VAVVACMEFRFLSDNECHRQQAILKAFVNAYNSVQGAQLNRTHISSHTGVKKSLEISEGPKELTYEFSEISLLMLNCTSAFQVLSRQVRIIVSLRRLSSKSRITSELEAEFQDSQHEV